MKKDAWKKEEIAEDFCFTCKDGGHLRVCDFKDCLKAYHPHCVEKDPSFLESDERWTCGWHTCGCKKSSIFQCYCCPNSFCRSCIKSAEFVQVKQKSKTKGFCCNCLRLALMIEENRNVDSDGEEVDFSNTETYEFLFKDYWEIIKDKERLNLVDLQAADAYLKRGENCQNGSDSDKLFEEGSIVEDDNMEDDSDAEKLQNSKGKRGRPRGQIKTPRKKGTFSSWGSEELMTFLASIGKDTKNPLAQVDVCEIVKDYVQSKNLFQPDKKRKIMVIPDERLRSVFRKKKLKYHKIFDLLKSHLAEYADDSDEFSFPSEDDEVKNSSKKQRRTNSDSKSYKSGSVQCRKIVLEPPKSCYAAIVADNIKRVYLKRTLILELLKDPQTFESKVVGCFVRVKNDPKDFYSLVKNAFQLSEVTGIKKSQVAYRLGDTSLDIVLCISNFPKDIYISMLSDDDFAQEELDDLCQLVKKGLSKRPTIAELERKIKSVHEDIMNHWINREILKLQKQIDRANEKGWRRELDQYIDRRELLRAPEERMRLLKEIPEIIADTEEDIIAIGSSQLNFHGLNEGAEAAYLEKVADGKPEGNDAASSQKIAEIKLEGNRDVAGDKCVSSEVSLDESKDRGNEEVALAGDNGFASQVNVPKSGHRETTANEDAAVVNEDGASSPERITARILEGTEPMACMDAASSQAEIIERMHEGGEQQKSLHIIIEIEEEDARIKTKSEIPIINLDEDDEDIPDASKANKPTTTDDCEEIVQASAPASHQEIWHYLDPSGIEQGPFTLHNLRVWDESGYFDESFKVWRTGQSSEDAVLLKEAFQLAFP